MDPIKSTLTREVRDILPFLKVAAVVRFSGSAMELRIGSPAAAAEVLSAVHAGDLVQLSQQDRRQLLRGP